MAGKLYWERIAEYIQRHSTPEGWIVRIFFKDLNGLLTPHIIYVPDSKHEWVPELEGDHVGQS